VITQVDIYSPQILVLLYSQTIIVTKPQLLFNSEQVLHGWQQPLRSNMQFKESESFCSALTCQHLSFPHTQDYHRAPTWLWQPSYAPVNSGTYVTIPVDTTTNLVFFHRQICQ